MFLAAHRGTRLHGPENTLRALLSGYTGGAQAIEFDLQLSRDGEVVLCHDGTVSRMTGLAVSDEYPSLRVLDLDFDNLAAMDFSPGFARFRGWSDFRYHHEAADRVEIITLDEALTELPPGVPKLIEIKYDSTIDTGRGDEMVSRVLEIFRAHGVIDECVLYALDRDVVRRVRAQEPRLRMCAFDYKVPQDEQLALLDETGGDGLVLQLADVFTEELELTPLGAALAERYAAGSLRVGAVLYPYRGSGIPWIPSDAEMAAMRAQPWIWSCATDSMIAVKHHAWTSCQLLDTRFEGRQVDSRRTTLGYAKRNRYAEVYQDDGVHVRIGPYDEDPDPETGDDLEGRVAQLEEEMLYARKTWPFYSGGGVGVRMPIRGDFIAEVEYELHSAITQAFTLEMAVVNVDPGEHVETLNAHGTHQFPSKSDTFFDPHGAPPYVGVEHDEDDGYRINWNRGTAYENNRYGAPVGDGATPRSGRMRLERRGEYVSAYYRNDVDAPDWVCVGAVHNAGLNGIVYLRCVAKRWRQRSGSGFHPIPANHVTFRHLQVHTVHPRSTGEF